MKRLGGPALLLCLIPLLAAVLVWLSPLSFVPVPWPDDSAFYFVAKDLFQWPPRWVMLPQAPFEPTYRIFNFNTMPLYPILIGLGRWVGIDGSFGIKFWPLAGWALSGSLLCWFLLRRGLAPAFVAVVALAFGMDPVMRWASVLLRPESLIGLFGVLLVLYLYQEKTEGLPARLRPRRLWDPVALLLALSAYAHFNAIHLVLPVLVAYGWNPRRLLEIGARTLLYLSPWIILVAWHFGLFVHQMTTQWERLAVRNDWLDSVPRAIDSLIQSLGSPEPWPPFLKYGSMLLWLLIGVALAYLVIVGVVLPLTKPSREKAARLEPLALVLPAASWVLSSLWLWHSKPEVWFVYYIHLAVLTFTGLLLLAMRSYRWPLFGVSTLLVAVTAIFTATNVAQAEKLYGNPSWRWSTYHSFIDCIDQRLTELAARRADQTRPFRVWDPTFPDVTVELSRRHPDWELTRTNDFSNRTHLAIRHAHEVDAVVVPETLQRRRGDISAPWSEHPEVYSVWMTWQQYFLSWLWREKDWKTERYLCQRDRWMAFIFSDPQPQSHPESQSDATPESATPRER